MPQHRRRVLTLTGDDGGDLDVTFFELKINVEVTRDSVCCTVAIPVFDRRELICGAIDSALAQSIDGLEILVVDNASTDGTWELIQSYTDPRLHVFRNESNLGLFGNFNRCLSLARGEYLRFLCSDDRLAPNCLGQEIALLEKNPDVAMVSSPARRVDEFGRFIGLFASELPPAIYAGADVAPAVLWLQVFYGKNPLNCPSGVLMRRSAALAAGKFDLSLHLAGDLDYYFRLLKHGHLAVSGKIGCVIVVHNRQAGTEIGRGDKWILELSRFIEENAQELRCRHLYDVILRQAGAYSFWLEWKLRSIGMPPTREFLCARRQVLDFHWFHIALGLLRMLAYRSWGRLTQHTFLPILPLRPL